MSLCFLGAFVCLCFHVRSMSSSVSPAALLLTLEVIWNPGQFSQNAEMSNILWSGLLDRVDHWARTGRELGTGFQTSLCHKSEELFNFWEFYKRRSVNIYKLWRLSFIEFLKKTIIRVFFFFACTNFWRTFFWETHVRHKSKENLFLKLDRSGTLGLSLPEQKVVINNAIVAWVIQQHRFVTTWEITSHCQFGQPTRTKNKIKLIDTHKTHTPQPHWFV